MIVLRLSEDVVFVYIKQVNSKNRESSIGKAFLFLEGSTQLFTEFISINAHRHHNRARLTLFSIYFFNKSKPGRLDFSKTLSKWHIYWNIYDSMYHFQISHFTDEESFFFFICRCKMQIFKIHVVHNSKWIHVCKCYEY